MPDPIFVVPYEPTWPALFQKLSTALRNELGPVALRIDHIGSTSIEGLAAKPIIDMQVSVTSFEPLNAFRSPLERLGYVFRANNDDLTKRYFREAPGTRRTHIHVRQAGSWSEQFALLFRDYLRQHPADAARYADLKFHLAEALRNERHKYVDAKSPLIWEIMQLASVWSQKVGWTPGRSDA